MKVIWEAGDITGRLTEYMRPKSKHGHIKHGDKVVCGPNRLRRYFSHERNGIAFCFTASDEWTSKGAVTQWRFCELWDGKKDNNDKQLMNKS